MCNFFEEYIGKTVTNPEYIIPPEEGEDAWEEEYDEELDERPYDEDAEGEEADWSISTALLFTVKGDKLVRLEPDVRVYCPGDSGLGDVDPWDYWESKDNELAESFLRRITS